MVSSNTDSIGEGLRGFEPSLHPDRSAAAETNVGSFTLLPLPWWFCPACERWVYRDIPVQWEVLLDSAFCSVGDAGWETGLGLGLGSGAPISLDVESP